MITRRTLTQSMLACAIGIAIPRALVAQTPAASPDASSGVREVDVEGVPLGLSPDGTMLAGFGQNDTICIWDAQTLEVVAESEPFPEIFQVDERSIAWSPDSSAIAWSLHAARNFVDSDIFVFDLASGAIVNLTEDEPKDKPAVNLIGDDAEGYVLDIDVYPAWSPDGESLVFARSVASGGLLGGSSIGTTICRVARDGGEVEVLGPVSPGIPLAVSSIRTGAEDGSMLFTTWPPAPDDPVHGVFRMSADGVPEGIFTGKMVDQTRFPILMDVAPAASKASVVSSANHQAGPGNAPGPTWFELDLETGIPTPFEEIFSLPTDPVSTYAMGSDVLFAAPAYLTDAGGSITGYLYATTDANFSEFTLWRHDALSGEATSLGTLEQREGSPRPGDQYSRIAIGTNGTLALFHGGTAWLADIDA